MDTEQQIPAALRSSERPEKWIRIDDSTIFAISEGVWYNHKMVKIDLSLGEVGSGVSVALKCFGRRRPGEYP
jgi:hypothetical protein